MNYQTRQISSLGEPASRFAETLVAKLPIQNIELRLQLLEVFSKVRRELFIEQAFSSRAYEDISLPIGFGQTISRPSTLASILIATEVQPHERVLEVGSGCGYFLALMAATGATVFGIEKLGPLASACRERLDRLGMQKVILRTGDGLRGWKEMAPFNVIVVSAAIPNSPQLLLEQLAPSGRLVAPIMEEGSTNQRLVMWKVVGGAVEGAPRVYEESFVEDCQFVIAS